MADRFKFIIVGRGMMGAAAARHLAQMTEGVALIGPDEPVDMASHQGVFASHYDEARITRTIDRDADWALLANRSIARYGEIAEQSGIDFYHETGCLIVGPQRGGANAYVGEVVEAAGRLGVSTDLLDNAGLSDRFSYFAFEPQCEGVFEAKRAGYINPRRLVAAQALLAERAGAAIIAETVVSVVPDGSGATVTTAEGRSYQADKVLVAAGGFSIAQNLLPRPVDLKVYARTVAFFEISDADLPRYAGMPSLIVESHEPHDHIYLLPPVRYPDGRTYLKIGGDPDDLPLASEPEIRAWFRRGGRDSTRDHLKRIIDRLVPALSQAPVTMSACVTSFTPTGYPAIGPAGSDKVMMLTGGCGAAAKSSDEIGRLGAEMLLTGRINDEGYSTDFEPHFLA